MKGRVGPVVRRLCGGLALASAFATIFIIAQAPLGYRAVAVCGAAIGALLLIAVKLLWPAPPDPVLAELEHAIEERDELVRVVAQHRTWLLEAHRACRDLAKRLHEEKDRTGA